MPNKILTAAIALCLMAAPAGLSAAVPPTPEIPPSSPGPTLPKPSDDPMLIAKGKYITDRDGGVWYCEKGDCTFTGIFRLVHNEVQERCDTEICASAYSL